MRLENLLAAGTVITDDPTWQKEWPTEPNTLWLFFGYLNGRTDTPELRLVEAWLTGNGIVYISNGSFIYNNHKNVGKWKRIIVTSLPIL